MDALQSFIRFGDHDRLSSTQQYQLNTLYRSEPERFRVYTANLEEQSPAAIHDQVVRIGNLFKTRVNEFQMGTSLPKFNKRLVCTVLTTGTSLPELRHTRPVDATEFLAVTAGLDTLLDIVIKKYETTQEKAIMDLLSFEFQKLDSPPNRLDHWLERITSDLTGAAWDDLLNDLLANKAILSGMPDERKTIAREYFKTALVVGHGKERERLEELNARATTASSVKIFNRTFNDLIDGMEKAGHDIQATADMVQNMYDGVVEMRTEIEAQSKRDNLTKEERAQLQSDIHFFMDFTNGKMTPDDYRSALSTKTEDGKRFKYFPNLTPKTRKEKLEVLGEQKESDKNATHYTTQFVGLYSFFATTLKELRKEGLITLDENESRVFNGVLGIGGITTAILSSNPVLGAQSAVSLLAAIMGTGGIGLALQRHKKIMKAFNGVFDELEDIKEQLEEIESNLKTIVNNQADILDSVQQVGALVVKTHELQMMKLDVMQRDILYCRAIAIEILGKEVSHGIALQDILENSRNPARYGYFNGAFHSEKGLENFRFDCGRLFSDTVSGLDSALGPKSLSEISSLFRMESYTSSTKKIEEAHPDEARFNTHYIDRVYTPLREVYFALSGKRLNHASRLSLAHPARELLSLTAKEDTYRDLVADESLNEAAKMFTLKGVTERGMKTPLSPGAVLRYAKMLVQVHRLFPLIDSTGTRIISLDDLSGETQNARGREPLEKMISLVDLCIAQIALSCGEGVIPSLLTLLVPKKATTKNDYKKAVEKWNKVRHQLSKKDSETGCYTGVLHTNPYFASNFSRAIFLKHFEGFSAAHLGYEFAYRIGTKSQFQRFFKAAHPEFNWTFERGGNGIWYATVDRKFKDVKFSIPPFPLPEPEEFSDEKFEGRRMKFPADLLELLFIRKRLIEEWLRYHPKIISEKASDLKDMLEVMVRMAQTSPI